MVEPEVAWNDSDANMTLQEEFVASIVARCLERRKAELTELERDTAPLERVAPPFPRVSYTEAVERLKALGAEMAWGRDLGGDEETLLAKVKEETAELEREAGNPKGLPDGRGKPETIEAELGDLLFAVVNLALVPRSPQVRHVRARGLRPGHRAYGGVDLRHPPHPGGDRLPAHALQAVAVRD